MFKKIVFLVSLLMTSQVVQAEIRIGVVNIPLLMQNAPQAADAKKRLEREFAPKDRQLVSQQKAIKQLEERLSRDGLTMTESSKRSLERDIISKRREAQRAQQDPRRHDLPERSIQSFVGGQLRRLRGTTFDGEHAPAAQGDDREELGGHRPGGEAPEGPPQGPWPREGARAPPGSSGPREGRDRAPGAREPSSLPLLKPGLPGPDQERQVPGAKAVLRQWEECCQELNKGPYHSRLLLLHL